jgi:cytochrome b subunit of formate dehydrogenase/nitrate/TMAO reductase-like tetraheme cytochrome c subunit
MALGQQMKESRSSRYLCILTLFLLINVFYSTSYAQSNEECMSCHSDDSMTMEKNGREFSIFVNENVLNPSAHGKLTCISCHTGFDPYEIPHKENIRPIDCMTCHKSAPVKHSFHKTMFGTSEGKNGGIAVSCKGCHGTHDVIPIKSSKSKWSTSNLNESCGTCHPDVKESFIHSDHAIALSKGVTQAPNCITCHKNNIVAAEETDILKVKQNQQKLCLSCHVDDPDISDRSIADSVFVSSYSLSIHSKELAKGNANAANCVDCHSSHNILKGTNQNSPVSKSNIPETCGSCHEEITKEYQQSSHGLAVAKGNLDSPVCTSCHGEHKILDHLDPASPVAFKNVSAEVCSPCHSSVRLSEKYGITADRFRTFQDSYHGLALRGGSVSVANCASCHGVHNILPSSNPASTISKENLVNTCGSCHPGANENFTVGKVHVTMAKEDEPILYWIATAYIFVIISVVGGMFFHNVIDFYRKSKIKKLKQRGLIKHETHGHSLYLRMTVNERIQHITLAVSFILLVITGFMLRFPDAWWVRHIRDLSENAFEMRSLLHRIAAVVMVIVSLYHVYYVAFTNRGRQLIKDLLPVYKDLTDAIGVAKFNLGFSKVKPKLDRFSYVEKAEYWALIWGTIVMTITGVIMWFDNTFMGLFTKLGWDIARTIHYYEAWLAFLSIVVWHFYFVIFNPDVYPMSVAWFKGTLTEEEMAEEHPLELERLKEGIPIPDEVIEEEEQEENNS